MDYKSISPKLIKAFPENRPKCKNCLVNTTGYSGSSLSPEGMRYKRHKKDYCEDCGFKAIHMCQLDVDHIYGNHANDDLNNLKTLCANCHRLKTRLTKQDRSKRWRAA